MKPNHTGDIDPQSEVIELARWIIDYEFQSPQARYKSRRELEDIYAVKILKLISEAEERVAENALIIADYWIEEDGRPKHLIQDLWDVKDISVLDHIDQKYIDMHRAKLSSTNSEANKEK